MQSVADAFSVEEVDSTRRVAHGLQVAWKKDFRSTIKFFTIGVSSIGGTDTIAGPAGVQSNWNRYIYENETPYALSYAYERELSEPTGGVTKALAEVDLANTGDVDYGGSLSFDGTDDRVTVSGVSPASHDAKTMVVWVNINAIGAASQAIAIWSTGSSNRCGIFVTNTGIISVEVSGAPGSRRYNTTTTLTPGTWYRIGFSNDTLDPAAGRAVGDITVYINGVNQSLTTQSIGGSAGTGTVFTMGVIGPSNLANDLNGYAADLRVYNSKLTDANLATDYNTGAILSGLALRWKLDERTGTVAHDTSGSNFNGTTTGAVFSTNNPGVPMRHTPGRFTPQFMGGDSAIFTANGLPRRPMIINAGFEVDEVEQTVPQFVGVTTRPPALDTRRGEARLVAEDFVGFIQNSYVDKTAMFSSQWSDDVIESTLSQLGYSTAQYELDPGLNRIGFGLFETGQRFSDMIQKIVEAEGGHFYQDEEGKLRYENRQHWDNFPHSDVQRIIATNMVLNAKGPDYDHIINVVEVTAKPREVQDSQVIWQTGTYGGAGVIEVPASSQVEVWANYDDPIFQVTTPVPNGTPGQTSYFAANSSQAGDGSDATGAIYLKSITNFAQASKMVFQNTTLDTVWITTLDIWGRPARKTGDIYYKGKSDSSITAYEEHILKIDNDYIQDQSWAQSYAETILADFAQPENLQEITIRAIPELQLGDLISWQGKQWRIYGIRTMISPSEGFTQELKLLQRALRSYFRIGVSTIGGSDRIAA